MVIYGDYVGFYVGLYDGKMGLGGLFGYVGLAGCYIEVI